MGRREGGSFLVRCRMCGIREGVLILHERTLCQYSHIDMIPELDGTARYLDLCVLYFGSEM